MHVASHPQTGWTIHQVMNNTFEREGKITPDKNETKNKSFFSSVLHGTRSFAKIYLFCMSLDQHLRDIEDSDEISYQRSTRTNIINILQTVQRNIKKYGMEKSKSTYSLQRKER